VTTYNSRGLPETRIEPAAGQYSSVANSTTTIAYNGDGNPGPRSSAPRQEMVGDRRSVISFGVILFL
jgi:hypothetical protein